MRFFSSFLAAVLRTPQSGVLSFAGSSGAVQKNVDGVKKPLPGTPATLTPAPKPFVLTSRDATPPDWSFVPMTAVRTPLGP